MPSQKNRFLAGGSAQESQAEWSFWVNPMGGRAEARRQRCCYTWYGGALPTQHAALAGALLDGGGNR